MHISGTVYKADGITPAAGTVLYFYHTDQNGVYPQGKETGWGRRHGYSRGWLKTNDNGQYSIKTLKPGAYPNRRAAAHIHCIIKEDNLNEYYVGDFLFEDDPLLSDADKSNRNVPWEWCSEIAGKEWNAFRREKYISWQKREELSCIENERAFFL